MMYLRQPLAFTPEAGGHQIARLVTDWFDRDVSDELDTDTLGEWILDRCDGDGLAGALAYTVGVFLAAGSDEHDLDPDEFADLVRAVVVPEVYGDEDGPAAGLYWRVRPVNATTLALAVDLDPLRIVDLPPYALARSCATDTDWDLSALGSELAGLLIHLRNHLHWLPTVPDGLNHKGAHHDAYDPA